MTSKMYKWCVVPQYINTSIHTPEKVFIYVPNAINIRRKWLQLVGRDPTAVSTKSSIYFCEDHFDLSNDMENYTRYKMIGSVPQIRMKPGCMPSKFECQPDRIKRTSSNVVRSVVTKRKRMTLVKESLEMNELDGMQSVNIINNSPGVSTDSHGVEVHQMTDKSIQIMMKPSFRSKSTQTNIQSENKAMSPIKMSAVSVSTSSFKLEAEAEEEPQSRESTTNRGSAEHMSDGDSDSSQASSEIPENSLPSSSDCSFAEEERSMQDKEYAQLSLRDTIRKIKKKPRFYVGVPEKCYYLIKLIEEETNISEKHILMCLKKIRHNTTFSELADDFAISLSYASKIFFKNIPIIASVLRPFIIKLGKTTIKRNLPIAFRHRYSRVTCIIDCLEIGIQKPSKAVDQVLTWSNYKKANTVKYLISSTPDGIINYISPGYGGRVSDVSLVENCDFLDTLESGVSVLADRGCKHIEQLFLERGVELVRPPSVSAGSKLTKTESRLTKQIASLQIHIERVIHRVREFSMLKPHSGINLKLVRILDDVITISCALINLQGSIIK